ncbi:MAG TPA: lysophospholipid acyltransferase family protein [Caulobacteraceae bacterium]|jgi:hypothetical protein
MTPRRALKLLARQAWVQASLAWLVSTYLALTLRTMRWRFENRAIADAAAASPDGVLACFWHGRIALAPACRPIFGRKPRRVLISSSPDGEFIAKVVRRLGFPAIRGSSTTDDRKERRSVQAFREAVTFIEEGGAMIVTPDGPRGPPEQVPQGPVMLARTRGTPVLLMGIAARPVLRLKSWDRTQIPLPFGKGCAVFDGPLVAPRKADAQAVRAMRADWQARLSAAQSRAEALLVAS